VELSVEVEQLTAAAAAADEEDISKTVVEL